MSLSVVGEKIKSDTLLLKWVMMWTLYKSEGKPTSFPVSYNVPFSNSRRSWELSTGNHSIRLHCTLKYSIKNISIVPVISIHIPVNVRTEFIMQHCWVCALWQYSVAGLHRTISTGLLPSSSLHGPLVFNLQSKKLDVPRTQHQSSHPTALFSYIQVPVISISLLTDRHFKSQSCPPSSLS